MWARNFSFILEFALFHYAYRLIDVSRSSAQLVWYTMTKTNAVTSLTNSRDAAALCSSAQIQPVLTPTPSLAPVTTSAPTAILFLWYKQTNNGDWLPSGISIFIDRNVHLQMYSTRPLANATIQSTWWPTVVQSNCTPSPTTHEFILLWSNFICFGFTMVNLSNFDFFRLRSPIDYIFFNSTCMWFAISSPTSKNESLEDPSLFRIITIAHSYQYWVFRMPINPTQ